MSKQTGGQAFPRQKRDYDGQNNVLQYQEEGMTLRDYFAAKAMQGWLASYGESDRHPALNDYEHQVASMSYKMADAMLKVRGDA